MKKPKTKKTFKLSLEEGMHILNKELGSLKDNLENLQTKLNNNANQGLKIGNLLMNAAATLAKTWRINPFLERTTEAICNPTFLSSQLNNDSIGCLIVATAVLSKPL